MNKLLARLRCLFPAKKEGKVVWIRNQGRSVDRPATFRPIGAVPLLSSEPVVSGFDDDALTSVGQVLRFNTHYGHGWIGTESWDAVPESFSARLLRFYEYQGNRRGGVAKIAQQGHRCDGLWVMFATRHIGTFNFTDHVAHCNIALLADNPRDPIDDGNYWVIKENIPGIKMAGFAEVTLER